MLKNALIVDDSRLARLTLKKLLVKYDIEVSEAEGVMDAEQWITHNLIPDLVFMDVMMPDLDGFDGLARLRKNPDTRDVPVIMYSGDISEEARKKARDRGATGYLPKPADANRLDHLLNALVQRRKTQPAEEKPAAAVSAPEPLQTADTAAAPPQAAVVPQQAEPAVRSEDFKDVKRRIEELEMRQTMQELNTGNLDFNADIERQRRDLVFLQRQLAAAQQQVKISLILGGAAAFLAAVAIVAHFL